MNAPIPHSRLTKLSWAEARLIPNGQPFWMRLVKFILIDVLFGMGMTAAIALFWLRLFWLAFADNPEPVVAPACALDPRFMPCLTPFPSFVNGLLLLAAAVVLFFYILWVLDIYYGG